MFLRRPAGASAAASRAVRAGPSGRHVGVVSLISVMAASFAGKAHAQLLDRYYPANVPAYQDWATAATPQQGDTIYGPLGVRVGSFIISPALSETVGYDSNPAGASPSNGSSVLYDTGSVEVNSDWTRNAVNAAFTASRTDFFSLPRQSYTTWTATAGGVLDYGDNQIQAGYSHIYAVTLPTDVGTFGVSQPIVSQVDDVRVSDTIGPGRVTLVPTLTNDVYQFSGIDNAISSSTGGLNNRDALTASLTAGYEFSGGHNALIAVSNTLTDYFGQPPALQPANYDDVSIMAGLEYKHSALLIYRLLVGYEERSSTSSGLNKGTISAPAAEFDVVWSPSVLTTVTGKISQSLEDAPSDVSQGLKETNVQMTVTRSVRSDVTLDGSVEYARATFQSSSNTETTVSVMGEATWSLTRRLALSLRYVFSNASGGGASGETAATSTNGFDRHQVLLQARVQL